jgi:hypothetical protein
MTSVRGGVGSGESVPPNYISMEKGGGPASGRTGVPMRERRRPNSRQVLDVGDRTARTILFVLHEEIVNQYLGMAFYGGVFIEGGVSVRAMEYGVEAPYSIRATLDLAGQWRIVGFTRNSISHVVLFCIR